MNASGVLRLLKSPFYQIWRKYYLIDRNKLRIECEKYIVLLGISAITVYLTFRSEFHHNLVFSNDPNYLLKNSYHRKNFVKASENPDDK